MDPAKLLELLSGGAEFAQDVPVQIEFVDRPRGIRTVEILFCGPGVMQMAQGAPTPVHTARSTRLLSNTWMA